MNRQQHSKLKNGIGSYVLKNGQVRYRVVMNVNGETKTKGGFTTKGAAVAHRDLKRADVQRGDWIDPAKGRLLFGTLAEEWINTAPLRPTTRANYRHLLAHQLTPWLEVPLSSITFDAVDRWVGKMRTTTRPGTGRPPARASVVKAHALLSKVCMVAVKRGHIKANPCRGVEFGKAPTIRLYCPTPEEVLALADAVPADYRALVLLAGIGGLRWGEAIALTRADIDLTNGTVDVHKIVAETIDDEVYLQYDTKTAAGIRVVCLHATVTDALRTHLAQHAQPGPDGLLFYASRSAPGEMPYLRRANFRNRVWNPAVKKAGVPKTRFHDLRHAAATMAAQSGYTTRELMAHIGHSTSKAAMGYQHADKNRMKALPAMLNLPNPASAATGTDNVIPIRR